MSVPAPKPKIRDHARVAWVALASVWAFLIYFLYAPVAPIVSPLLRRRTARLTSEPAPPLVDPELPDVARWNGRTIFLVAGEASGDRLAARVVEKLRVLAPGARLRGYAGPACRDAGVALDRDLTKHAVIGVVGVLRSLGFWWRLCAETLARFREEPPDLLLTVDFPGLNVRLLRWARAGGIRTVHFVAPGLWAHTPWRVFRWRRAVDHVLALFPFELHWFVRRRIPTTYVGHPLFEEPLPEPRTPATRPAGPIAIELWPGSRRRELHAHVPLILDAAAWIEARLPHVRFVARLAEETHRAWFEADAARATQRPARMDIAVGSGGPTRDLAGALVSSGTATAELAVRLLPMAAFYRVKLRARIAGWLMLTTPWICLPNLIAGRTVVPERIVVRQRAAGAVAGDLLAQVATDDAWLRARRDLEEVRARLASHDVSERVARTILAEPFGSPK